MRSSLIIRHNAADDAFHRTSDMGQYWSIICCHLARGERPESWIISIGCEGGSSRRARSDLLRLSKLKRGGPVARKSHSAFRDAVGSVRGGRLVNKLARELGVVKRQRKIRVRAFLAAVVLGFATGSQRTLAGMRRAYELA